ncbi:inactive protein RESTRICTED TEV MOVEMENT 2 [Amborella trichopoda]|uniref:SHSP domain-containing protein n=1 Tax=Amborella trichopoda TaxID=13333 RepID=W1NE02_AMBTC|nr:inactive protein RESTRICTED TEV MOVEMENT 2 [Amborella trichopoda]ERM93593.1 hypothetical protein AMTR_s00004p00123620 [Amborella trichopoda]|eukprot:XP_006826356.1 inactive protein RESTRICTED TEV MOVEMENT 2 [Amborella trichopoda]
MNTRSQAAAKQSVEEFQPALEWIPDPESNILLVHLPGFTKEEIRVQIDNRGGLRIIGERSLEDGRTSRFTKNVQLPGDSDIESIRARFERGQLFVITPKKMKKQDEQPIKDNGKAPQQVAETQKTNGILEPKPEAKVPDTGKPPLISPEKQKMEGKPPLISPETQKMERKTDDAPGKPHIGVKDNGKERKVEEGKPPLEPIKNQKEGGETNDSREKIKVAESESRYEKALIDAPTQKQGEKALVDAPSQKHGEKTLVDAPTQKQKEQALVDRPTQKEGEKDGFKKEEGEGGFPPKYPRISLESRVKLAEWFRRWDDYGNVVLKTGVVVSVVVAFGLYVIYKLKYKENIAE